MAYKVLIADDDRNFLTSLSVRLKAEGFEVACAQDSYQAVEVATRFRPDVLVLDINMPAGDGFTVQQRVEKMTHLLAMPVIYLTGERSERVEMMAKTQHAFALMFKPFETDELLRTIRSAVTTPQAAAAA